MEQTLKKVVSVEGQLDLKSIDFFINAQLISIGGDWEWDLHSDNIFCADVIISLPPDYIGTKGIIHPDDLPYVREKLLSFPSAKPVDIEFRMITTYSEVKKLTGRNCFQVQVDELRVSSPERELADNAAKQKEFEKGHDAYHNLKNVVDNGEIITKTGKWYNNTSTNETYYSDNVFRIHALNPQSLNAHLNTFTSFIHPDDSNAVNEAFDKAYREKVPVFLEYRIITANGTEKFISQTTSWTHNYKGEFVVSGLIQDLTVSKALSNKIEKIENDLQFNNQLLQFNEAVSHTGYWKINLLTKQTYYSDNYYRIHGIKPQSIPAAANIFNNYIHPDDREKVLDAFKKIRKEHIPPDIEYCIIRHDGKLRHLVQKGLLMSHGNELLMTGMIRDITAEKAAEQKLLDQQEGYEMKDVAYQQIESTGGISSWVQDLRTGNSFCSDNIYELLGYKRNVRELTYKELLRSVLPEQRKKVSDEIAFVMEGEEEREVEFSILRVGEVRNIKGVFKLITTEEKRFFTATFQDVTKHDLLEQQLFEGAQLNELLAQNILDSVFITDINNKVVLWNRKCEQLFKLKQDNVIGRNYFDILPEHKTEEILTRFNSVLKGDLVREPSERLNGNQYYNLSMMPLKDKENKVIGILHVRHEVTKEMHLHNKLTERLNFIEKLLEETVDRIVVLDKNFNYVYWNKNAELYYRINKEYVVGKNILEVFPGMVIKPLYQQLKKALKGETIYIGSRKLENWEWKEEHQWSWQTEAEMEVAGEEGQYSETYLIPLLNERKEVTSVLWIVHDLTNEVLLQKQRTKTDMEIKQTKELLQSVFNASLHGIILFKAVRDESGEIKDFQVMLNNAVTEQWNGRDLTGKLYAIEFPQIIDYGIFDLYKKVLETGKPMKTEVLYEGSGFKNWFNISAVKVNEDELVATAEDITYRKRAEEELKENKEMLQQTTFATPDAITVYDLVNKQPLYLNNCLGTWLGYSSDALAAMTYEKRLNLIHPDDRNDLLQFNDRLVSAKDGVIISVEYRLQTRKGELLWIRNRSKPFKRNAEGKVTHILSVLQDITENKKAEQELLAHKQQILQHQITHSADEKLLQKKDEFISIASHELKTPVTNIKMSLHILNDLIEGLQEKKVLGPYIKKTDQQVNKLGTLIDELLDVTLVQEGQLGLNKSNFNVKEALKESINELGATAKGASIKIEGDKEINMYADRSRIQQVITNFLINAIKYSPSDKRITVRFGKNAGEIKVSVTDKGIGIPADDQSQVFDRYYRVDETAKQFAGLGLGLYISKEIVTKHGGNVGVISAPGEGSTFWFTIPVTS